MNNFKSFFIGFIILFMALGFYTAVANEATGFVKWTIPVVGLAALTAIIIFDNEDDI